MKKLKKVQNAFRTKGIYLHDGFTFNPKEICPFYWTKEDWKEYVDWLDYLEINLIEFAVQLSFLRKPATGMERERIRIMKEVIEYAHQKSMKVTVILSTNVITKLPDSEAPHGQLELDWTKYLICPRNKKDFEKTIALGEYYISEYRNADAFSVCAGDWGGCSCGTCSWETYIEYVKNYYQIVKGINQNAKVFILTWSIGYWSKPNPDIPFWRDHFDKEIEYTENIIDVLPDLPGDIGIIVPCHHLYRPFAMQQYADKEIPIWPTKSLVEKVRKTGHEFIAWPHFIMEDDSYSTRGQPWIVSRIGYIRKLVCQLMALGVQGIIGNLYSPKIQLLSAYAFSRLVENPGLSEEDVLKQFSEFIGNCATSGSIYNILLLLENSDPWEKDLPNNFRVKHTKSFLPSNQALAILDKMDKNIYSKNIPQNYCDHFFKVLRYTVNERMLEYDSERRGTIP